MKVVLIDDEYYALQGLKIELEEIGGVEVVGMYESGQKAVEEIHSLRPDVVFLDIEMPGMDGLELFQRIQEICKNISVVFVTAYNQYAVQAFELNALDYIVKPVQKARLIKTLERIKKEIHLEVESKRITIHCFRHFSVMMDGQEMNMGGRTKKAMELLAYLVCEKGRGVSKEKIAEALWPELDGKKSVSNLYLAYHYLKKQEKKTGIVLPIQSERGKMCIQIEKVDCDVIKFDLYLKACGHINRASIALAEKAVEVYKGMLFEDSYYSWAVEAQQYYEVVYGDLLQRMIAYYEQCGNVHKKKQYIDKFEKIFGYINIDFF